MIVTSKINVELAQPKTVPEIYAVQDDRYSRNLQINLLVNGTPLFALDSREVAEQLVYLYLEECANENLDANAFLLTKK